MKRKRSSLGQLLTSPRQYDIAECFSWLPSFQGSDSCLASPAGPCSGLLTLQQNLVDHSEGKMCSVTSHLHSALVLLGSTIKNRLSWNLSFPSTGSYIAFECIFPREYHVSHLPTGLDLGQAWPSNRWAARLGSQKLNWIGGLDLFVSKCMFTGNWIFLIGIFITTTTKKMTWEWLNP